MNKNKLYKMYISIWQYLGDIQRRKDCIKFAKENTKISLDKDKQEEVKNYWKRYCKVNTVFHDFYYEKSGCFDVKYIPDDLYYTKIDTFYNDWNAAKIVDNKCYYENLFSVNKSVRHPNTFIRRINGKWLDANWKLIDINKVINILNYSNAFFLKLATQSEGGKGVFYLDKSENDYIDKFINIVNNVSNDLVIQEPLSQCKSLAMLNKESINTIRILTLLRNNNVKVYSSILRMGVNNSKIDNASSGGITCGINENGYLKSVAYSANGDSFGRHPSSGICFTNVHVPGYQEAVELVKELHPIIPDFQLVSWDIAIDKFEKPVLVEVNLKYGELDFHQLNNGPLFGEDTKEILDEVFKKN